MQRGQVSLDFLLAIILFLVVVGFFFNYVNNLDTESVEYSNNISLFDSYIVYYDSLKSINLAFASNFSPEITLQKDANSSFSAGSLNFGQDYKISGIVLNCNKEKCTK